MTAIDIPADLPSRRCLVLGGSGYVGNAVCAALLEARAHVVATCFSRPLDFAALVSPDIWAALPRQPLAIGADLRDEAAIAALVAEAVDTLGGIDVLVHCAGLPVPPGHRDRQARQDLYTVLVDAALDACRLALPHMPAGGAIVVVGAIDGLRALPSPPDYAAAKGAQAALVRALAKEAGPRGVAVNLVAPGLLEDGVAASAEQHHRDDYLQHCSLKRFGKASEVAHWVRWLALENTYLTAQSIVLDGGL